MSSTNQTIALIDSDYRRRAQIAHTLIVNGRYVEPFESAGEFLGAGASAAILLVHDDGGLIEEVAAMMRASDRSFAIAAYGEDADPRKIVAAMRAGAWSFWSWPMSRSELFDAIAECELLLRPGIVRDRQKDEAMRRVKQLSPRERQVLARVAKGFANRDIATELGISARTVEVHRANMLKRLGAVNTPDALRIAFEARLDAA